MSVMEIPSVYNETLEKCLSCGKCMGRCESLQRAGMSLLEIANGMRNALVRSSDETELAMSIMATPGLVQAVRGCFFCENCIVKCEADIKVSELVYESRKVFQNDGLIERSAWTSVQVDQEWDIFTAYRAIYGIGYSDLTRHVSSEGHEPETDCQVAFFPGCSLAAYGPELCREVFGTIEELGGKTTMIDECCGSPLKSAGFLDRAAALEQRIVDEIVTSGAAEVVCACPGCRNMVEGAMAKRGLDVRAVTVSRFLREHGFAPRRVDGKVRFFKSCQDRDASYLDDTMALVDGQTFQGVICNSCCGAGGAVSASFPEQQQAKVRSILAQCDPGDTVVTMCPTCTYTQVFQMINDGRSDLSCKNYLELLFNADFDWNTTFAQLGGMWSGEYGAWLSQTFA